MQAGSLMKGLGKDRAVAARRGLTGTGLSRTSAQTATMIASAAGSDAQQGGASSSRSMPAARSAAKRRSTPDQDWQKQPDDKVIQDRLRTPSRQETRGLFVQQVRGDASRPRSRPD